MLMNAFGISTKTHHAAAIDGLRMGLEVLPGAALPNALLSILPDLLPAADLERLGDRLARAEHLKGRG